MGIWRLNGMRGNIQEVCSERGRKEPHTEMRKNKKLER
jgi:hypothetical protein